MSPIAISPTASYCHCDVILMTSPAYSARSARSPYSHYDVILIMWMWMMMTMMMIQRFNAILLHDSFIDEETETGIPA